ncbi:MAG: hypothetical protein PHD21_03205 [Flavobacteriales bacterium]|nr:hypothetical protein [Flavobacteriales bacterium]
MRRTFAFLAVIIIGVYQIIERWGTSRVWIIMVVMSFFIFIWGCSLYLNREKVSVFLHRLFTFSFTKEDIFTESEDKKSKFTTKRSIGDKIATALHGVMAVCAFLGSIAGVIWYIKTGDAQNETVKMLLGVSCVCWVLLAVFRRRKRYSGRVKRFLSRRR